MPFHREVRVALLVAAGWLISVALPAPVQAAEWMSPLSGQPEVTRPFDPPATPYGAGHRGVDLAGRPGEVVGAAGAGTIGYAAPLAGRGVITVLHDGDLRTTYEPVTATVVVGQAVSAGQPIGTLEAGHAGCPVAACLHWGLVRGEVYLDPMSLLQVGPIRLLPRTVDVGPGSGSGPATQATARAYEYPDGGHPDGGGQPKGDAAPAGGYRDGADLRDEAANGAPRGRAPDLRPVVAAGAGVALGAAFLGLRRRAPP